MSGKRGDDPADRPFEGEDEANGGKIATDPVLEAALRAAAEAVPDDEDPGPRVYSLEDPEDAGAAGSLQHSEGSERERRPESGSAAPVGDLLDEEIEAGVEPEVVYALRDELAATRDRLLRLQADFDNFRKRALKERQEAVQYGHQNLFKDLLSVVDNLDRAIGHAQESGGGDLGSFLQGVELVRRELLGVFEKHHVSEIEALGAPFDPALHEAMAQVEDGSVPPGTVVDVLQKGFALRDRLVRPARVVVARAPAKPDANGGGGAG